MSKTDVVQDFKPLTKEVVKVEKQVATLVVESQDDYENASALHALVKGKIKAIEEKRLEYVAPLTQASRRINADAKLASQTWEKLLESIQSPMLAFRRKVEAKRLEEERKLREAQAKKEERLKEKGKPVPFAVLPTVAPQQKTIQTDFGKTTAVKFWNFEILDYSKLDRDVLTAVFALAKQKGLIDQVIREKVKNGTRELSGVRIFEDERLS